MLSLPLNLGLALVLAATPPQPPDVWVFHAIEIQQKVGCVNNPVAEARHVWIRKGEGYEAERRALREKLRAEHGDLVRVSTFSVTVGKPRAIALVRKTLRCRQFSGPPKSVDSYRWHAGPDEAAVLRELEANRRHSTDVQAYQVVQWIDVAGELSRLAAGGQGYREQISRTYGPLQITFTSGKTASGRTSVFVLSKIRERMLVKGAAMLPGELSAIGVRG